MPKTETPERDRIAEMAAAVRSDMSGIEVARQRVDELLAHRDHLVRRMAEMGCSRPEIARKTGLSTSNVRWITERR